jgi:hypothetical protein
LTAPHDHDRRLPELLRQSPGQAWVHDYQEMLFTPLQPGTFRWHCWVSAQSILKPLLHTLVPSNRHPTRQRIPGRYEDTGSYAMRSQQCVRRQRSASDRDFDDIHNIASMPVRI